jgi:hypothetical protein
MLLQTGFKVLINITVFIILIFDISIFSILILFQAAANAHDHNALMKEAFAFRGFSRYSLHFLRKRAYQGIT